MVYFDPRLLWYFGMSLHLDEPAFVKQCGNRDHSSGGLYVAEELAVRPANLVAVGSMNDEHPRAVDVVEPSSKVLDCIAHDRQTGHGLPVGGISSRQRTVGERRRSTRYLNAIPNAV